MIEVMFGLKKTYQDRLACKFRRGFVCFLGAGMMFMQGCADVEVPGTRNVNIPEPTMAEERVDAINERPDSVLYLPLGRDVLVPVVNEQGSLPTERVGPFELRSETLAGALQLILAEYDISLAFETEEGLNRTITVANLQGPLNKVIKRVCSLADLYCGFEDGLLVVKATQTFTVKVPPISQDSSFMNNVASGLSAIIGGSPVIDQSTRTIIYEATQRTAEYAERYFQRMRTSTALIVFETYIWEVSLDSGNGTGIRWDSIEAIGKFTADITFPSDITDFAQSPISIGLPTTGFEEGGAFTPDDIFNFLSTFGTVKTISQPKITVLSGSEARLRVADTENFVSNVSQTIDNGQVSTSVNTSSVDTGFTLTIASSWDNSTVYADVDISLTDVAAIDPFSFSSQGTGANASTTTIQLPRTAERELTTQVRIRPGDSLLIAGLVDERDAYREAGPGFTKPLFPTERVATTDNSELVFLLRPRVIVYTSPEEEEYYGAVRGAAHNKLSPLQYDFAPFDSSSNASSDSFEGVPPVGTISSEFLDPGASF